jgi:hypothetical protein
MMPVCVLADVYPRAVRRARSPVAIGEIIVVVLTDLIKKFVCSKCNHCALLVEPPPPPLVPFSSIVGTHERLPPPMTNDKALTAR